MMEAIREMLAKSDNWEATLLHGPTYRIYNWCPVPGMPQFWIVVWNNGLIEGRQDGGRMVFLVDPFEYENPACVLRACERRFLNVI